MLSTSQEEERLFFFNVVINGCLKASREQLGNSFPSYSLTLWILVEVEYACWEERLMFWYFC